MNEARELTSSEMNERTRLRTTNTGDTSVSLGIPDSGGTPSAAVRAELLDAEVWQSPLEGYARATKLAVLMVDTSGDALGPCLNPQRIWQLVTDGATAGRACPFCLHSEAGCDALERARQTAEVAYARDRAGVVHLAVPVTLSDHVIAVILAGQVFESIPEQLLLDDLARATGRSAQALWDVARRQLPIGQQQLNAYGELLSTLADSYVRANYAGIVDRQRYAEILGLHADLAQRKGIESALREADRRKDEFLATLAHELRNPLAPMMSAVHLLDAEHAQATAERALSTLGRQMRHMVHRVRR